MRQSEGRRPVAGVLGIQRPEPVCVEVAQHVPDPAGAGERHLRDRRDIHALR